MNIQKEHEEKIEEIQSLEQSLQSLLQQKQRFQNEQIEIENALNELNKTKSKPYKIINGIMFEAEPEDLKKELFSKKEVIDIRIKSINKQEQEKRKKAEILQKEVLKGIKS